MSNYKVMEKEILFHTEGSRLIYLIFSYCMLRKSLIKVQPMFIVHDVPHEIVNNNSLLSTSQCSSSYEGLILAEVRLILG